jgi:isocitrate dehydrogenase
MSNVPITVAHGDGIGPEIMDATLHILKEAGARIDIETIEIGEKVYLAGNTRASHPSRWDSLRSTKVFPESSDHRRRRAADSRRSTLRVRKTLGLYAISVRVSRINRLWIRSIR